jgi:hypothetical protein
MDIHGVGRLVRALVMTLAVFAGVAVSTTNTAAAASQSASPSGPTLTGPVPGTPTIASTSFDLATVGYEQAEFFLSGTASSYRPTAPLTTDGRWSTAPSTTAPYTTRAVVYRPVSPARFNGTVVVEWLNVSGGVDAAPDWTLAHDALIDDGYAWVGVSVQAAGLDATKTSNPQRYAALTHPGDSYSYDLFAQAGATVRSQSDRLLEGLRPRRVLGIGESQSAFRLVTYVNGVHPLVPVYDGFFIHSGFGTGAPLSQAPLPTITPPTPTRLRTDLDVPVLQLETETDVSAGFIDARQPDTPMLRTWEVAGTSHYDYYGLGVGPDDPGDGRDAPAMLNALLHPVSDPLPGIIECSTPINSGPQHWVVQAAIDALDRWLRTGREPSQAPPLETTSTNPVVFALDANGNVQGGVRTPQVDAPLARLSGVGQTGSSFCVLFGTTVPFTSSELAAKYPTRHSFVAQWRAAVHEAVRGRFIRHADARDLERAAADYDFAPVHP